MKIKYKCGTNICVSPVPSSLAWVHSVPVTTTINLSCFIVLLLFKNHWNHFPNVYCLICGTYAKIAPVCLTISSQFPLFIFRNITLGECWYVTPRHMSRICHECSQAHHPTPSVMAPKLIHSYKLWSLLRARGVSGNRDWMMQWSRCYVGLK